MTGHGEKLSRKQEQAISALITSPTISAAAIACSVGDATLRRWLKLPQFSTAYKEARRGTVSQAVACMQQASSEAVQTLREIMGNTDAPATSRLSAAKTILELSLKSVELDNLEERLSLLEASMAEDHNSNGYRR